MTAKTVFIDERPIGPGHRPFIVAELSGNHNQDISRARALIVAAKEAGADAVKLQTYTPDTMTIDAPQEDFMIRGGPWDGQSLYDLYRGAHTPWEWHQTLFTEARALGLVAFSTPFDETAVDFLEDLDVPAYKIASFELTDLPLVRRIANTGKPVILSTGMANLDEIGAAVKALRAAGCGDLVLLHCVSGYPTPASEMNLRAIADLASRFGVVAGLSDHTLDNAVATASVALGACVIEKHVTMRRADGGPDAGFSLEPLELQALCHSCRTAWDALGKPEISLAPSETANLRYRRSLYVVKDMKKGDVFTQETVRRIRPAYGLPPDAIDKVLGRKAKAALSRGTALTWEMIEDDALNPGRMK